MATLVVLPRSPVVSPPSTALDHAVASVSTMSAQGIAARNRAESLAGLNGVHVIVDEMPAIAIEATNIFISVNFTRSILTTPAWPW